MKKLKLSLLMVALMVATIASAQVSFGIKGGINMSNIVDIEMTRTEFKPKIGFNIGVAADYEFMPSMAVQTGLFFTTKGAKTESSSGNGSIDMMYLQVPVHFAYKLNVTPGTRVVFHAGPYLAYGIGGKSSFDGGDKSNTFSSNLFKPFDAGLGLGVGAEFGPFLVDIGWDRGLVQIYNDVKMNNQNAYLSVGYKF